MKNIKTKIGILIATGLLASNLTVKNVNAEYKPNPSIKKLVNTLLKYPAYNSYKLPDGRKVKFEFFGSSGSLYTAYFHVDIIREDKTGGFETVRIHNFYLDNLEKDDLIGYKMENLLQIYNPQFEFKKFNELSKETQEKLRKEYNKIIEEAPENIIQEYQKKELQKSKEGNEKREMFEKNILDMLKK